jgi:hypothetical protein
MRVHAALNRAMISFRHAGPRHERARGHGLELREALFRDRGHLGQDRRALQARHAEGAQSIDEATGVWRFRAAARYSANLLQPHHPIPAANGRPHHLPPTLEPPRSTRGQAWTARAGGNAHLGDTSRAARARACSIAASRSTARPGSRTVTLPRFHVHQNVGNFLMNGECDGKEGNHRSPPSSRRPCHHRHPSCLRFAPRQRRAPTGVLHQLPLQATSSWIILRESTSGANRSRRAAALQLPCPLTCLLAGQTTWAIRNAGATLCRRTTAVCTAANVDLPAFPPGGNPQGPAPPATETECSEANGTGATLGIVLRMYQTGFPRVPCEENRPCRSVRRLPCHPLMCPPYGG